LWPTNLFYVGVFSWNPYDSSWKTKLFACFDDGCSALSMFFLKMASVKAANYYQTNKQKKYNNKNTQTSLDDFISEA